MATGDLNVPAADDKDSAPAAGGGRLAIELRGPAQRAPPRGEFAVQRRISVVGGVDGGLLGEGSRADAGRLVGN